MFNLNPEKTKSVLKTTHIVDIAIQTQAHHLGFFVRN